MNFGFVLKRNMHIASTIKEMVAFRSIHPMVCFVPTMGALHDGHLFLVKEAKAKRHTVVVSIFVNPTQFSRGEDLNKYPRQLEADLNKLKPLGVDCVFVPNQAEMYPADSLCHVEPSKFSNICEGQARPDFFRGVATIVCKLFNIVRPDFSFFGQKDISQCILIRKMVEDLNMPVNIVVCPTMRESDGLAMSSRNVYLTSTERSIASVLYRALNAAKDICEDNNKLWIKRENIVSAAREVLLKEPMVSMIEYISVASHIDMAEILTYNGDEANGVVISAAIRIGNVRLIDNVLVGKAVSDIIR